MFLDEIETQSSQESKKSLVLLELLRSVFKNVGLLLRYVANILILKAGNHPIQLIIRNYDYISLNRHQGRSPSLDRPMCTGLIPAPPKPQVGRTTTSRPQRQSSQQVWVSYVLKLVQKSELCQFSFLFICSKSDRSRNSMGCCCSLPDFCNYSKTASYFKAMPNLTTPWHSLSKLVVTMCQAPFSGLPHSIILAKMTLKSNFSITMCSFDKNMPKFRI